MGLSVLGSLGCSCLVNGNLKLQSFNGKERFGVNGFLGFPKLKTWRGTALLCNKSDVAIERTSPHEVRKEIELCYELIQSLGRGVIYLGSARMGPDHPHYQEALGLSRGQIANLLNCTTWSGGGPGLMDAVTKGAMEAGKPVGAFKIGKEAGGWQASSFRPYLPSETYITCRFFSARKHGLVDAAVRSSSTERTAVVALPGGVGTLDEMFEILGLIQLQRLGSALPVPFLVMNYDSFYTKLFEFLGNCENWGTVSKGEIEALWRVCDDNAEALSYLAEFYDLHQSNKYKQRSEMSRNCSS